MRELARPSRWTLRVRLTVLATLAVTVVLVVGGLVLGTAVRASLVEDAARAAALRSLDLVALVERGALPDPVPAGDADEALVQVVVDGVVTGGSGRATDLAPLDLAPPAPGDTVTLEVSNLPISDDPGGFVVAGTTTADGTATVWVASSLEDVGEALATTAGFALGALPVLMGVLGAVVWWLVGRALAPVEAIRAEAEATSGTDLHRRVPEPARDDEVGRLARTLNGMLARIDEASHRRRRFVADASHELRTPVASLRTRVETAQASPRTIDWSAVADDVLSDATRMEQLIDQLLLLARVDAGRLRAAGRPVDLDDVVGRVAGPLDGAPTVDLSGVRPAQVVGDPVLLEQVVRNLVDNARAHAAGRVAVSLGVVDGAAVLAVDDDGPGIPVGQRDEVFQRFVRLDGARSRPGGAGLGLAIVADIVAAHGGTVAATDGALGGARLEVRLPIGADEPGS